jgi:hypothetical protein
MCETCGAQSISLKLGGRRRGKEFCNSYDRILNPDAIERKTEILTAERPLLSDTRRREETG